MKTFLRSSGTDVDVWFGFGISLGIQKQPVQWEKMSPALRMQYLERHHQYMNSTHGPSSTHKEQKNIDHVLTFIRSVNAKNCGNR